MKCQRCRKETNIHIMSQFNTQEICIACSEAERKKPDYKDAVKAEQAAIRSGDYNFKGIGLR